MAQRELAGMAVHQVKRDGQDDVDPDADDDVEVVRVDPVGEMRNAEGCEQGDEQVNVRARHGTQEELRADGLELRVGTKGEKIAVLALSSKLWTLDSAFIQTFSAVNLPSRPAGRNSRMMIRIAKAMASLYVDHWLPLTKVSTVPSSSPPRAAPGMLPTPPSTAATKALRPGMTPISGSIDG